MKNYRVAVFLTVALCCYAQKMAITFQKSIAQGVSLQKPDNIYKDQHIDHFLFNFKPGEVSVKKEEQFSKLLEIFIQTYQFPMEANSKFTQCSPVVYSD